MYVGQTIKSMAARLNTHFSKYSRCARLKSAIEKHGKENFKIEVIVEISRNSRQELFDELNRSERSWIASFDTLHPNGYNLTDGGDRASMEPETRRRIIEKHMKPIVCNETLETWPSIKECAKHFGVKPKQISRVLKGQRKRLKWAYSFSYLPKQS